MITVVQIRARRAIARLTQAQLAARAGISTTAMNNIEHGTDAKGSTLRTWGPICALIDNPNPTFHPNCRIAAHSEGTKRAKGAKDLNASLQGSLQGRARS
jgi:DNA-binding XRE family transcriptional regulator